MMPSKSSILLLVVLLLSVLACSEQAPSPTAGPEDVLTPTAFIEPSPNAEVSDLTVVLAFEGQAEYVSAAKADPESDLKMLFQEHVVEPYWRQCAEGSEYGDIAQRAVANPIRDLDGLEQMIQTLKDSEIERQIEEAYEQAKNHFPGEATTVCVSAIDPENMFVRDRMNGVTGFSPGSGKIWLQVYPQGDWEKWIGYTVAHEHHHSTTTSRYYDEGGAFNLLNYFIFEGRADTFAHQMYPELVGPWTDALTEEEEKGQWENIQGILNATSDVTLGDYMFGNPRRDIPVWTGYTIGYAIVQDLLEKQPDLSIEDWSAMEAEDILEESGYGQG